MTDESPNCTCHTAPAYQAVRAGPPLIPVPGQPTIFFRSESVVPAEATGGCHTLDNFALDSVALTATHRATLASLAQVIVRDQVEAADIIGFASTDGADQYNLGLGRRRALNVSVALREELERQAPGSSARLTVSTESRGEREQVPGGAPANRRVVVCLRGAHPVGTRSFRVTAKSFIAPIGTNIGVVCFPDLIAAGGLIAFARATDAAFSEAPADDRIFVVAPPDNKGYRLFSSTEVLVNHRGPTLLSVGAAGAVSTDVGRECAPGTGLCLDPPRAVLELPFSTTRVDASRVRFRWGIKGRPPLAAEAAFQVRCQTFGLLTPATSHELLRERQRAAIGWGGSVPEKELRSVLWGIGRLSRSAHQAGGAGQLGPSGTRAFVSVNESWF